MHNLDGLYELCVRLGGDPERCSFGVFVDRLIEEAELEECVRRRSDDDCFKACVRRCGGGEEGCAGACRTAVDAALARNLTEDVLKKAVDIVVKSKFTIAMPEAVAGLISDLLKMHIDADCEVKAKLFRVVGIAVIDLRNAVWPDLMLLFAPLISTVYGCVGEGEVDSLLEGIRAAAGEEEAKKISAALDAGKVAVKRVIIEFPPVK